MKVIVFENVNFYGDNWNSTLSIPDDMVFTEVLRFKTDDGKDPQRFYASLYPYDKNLEYTFNKNKTRIRTYNILDTWLYVELTNVHPVHEDLPLISIEEFNFRYLYWFSKYTIEYQNPKRIDLDTFFNKIKNGELPTDDELPKDLYYTVSMYKILGFAGGGENLNVEVAEVAFNSWLRENEDIKSIDIRNIEFNKLLSGDLVTKGKYIFDDSISSWNKFDNRITEILDYTKRNKLY